MKTTERCQRYCAGIFIGNFEHILNLFSSVFIFDFEQMVDRFSDENLSKLLLALILLIY